MRVSERIARWQFGMMFAASLYLAGCSTGSLFDSDTPVPQNYVLAPAPAAAGETNPALVDVAISRPDLAPGLDTDRIAVLKERQLDYYRGVRWGSRAIEMIQTLVVDSLEDQRLFRSVTPEQARVAGDYVLDLQVRDFQAEYTPSATAPTVHVALIGRLIRVIDRKLVATLNADAQTQATQDRLGEVLIAFERASHQAILDLGTQVSRVVTEDAETLRTARGEKPESADSTR